MFEFNIGDPVMIKSDPENISTIVDCTIEETGRLIYKVEKKGYFYPEDLRLPTEENIRVAERDFDPISQGRYGGRRSLATMRP